MTILLLQGSNSSTMGQTPVLAIVLLFDPCGNKIVIKKKTKTVIPCTLQSRLWRHSSCSSSLLNDCSPHEGGFKRWLPATGWPLFTRPRGKKTFATELKSQAVSGLFKKTKGSEKDVNVLDCVLCLCGNNDKRGVNRYFFHFEKKWNYTYMYANL